jgi:hypothetical protein
MGRKTESWCDGGPRRVAAWRCGAALIAGIAAGITPAAVAAQDGPQAAPVRAEAFAGLDWLQGRWLGSGGGFDAFYEAYRFLNDSTIEQTTWPDETFETADGRSTIELRNGRVLKLRDGAVESVITRISGDTLRFDRTTGRGGFTWYRVSDDEWRAELDRPSGSPVVYVLRRIREQ